MPALSHPSDRAVEGRADWTIWNLDASVVTRSEHLHKAREIADQLLADVDRACSRFRPDSETITLAGASASGVDVSPTLAALVRGSLSAAEWTQGDVDPTLGAQMSHLGYDRDIADIRLGSASAPLTDDSVRDVPVPPRGVGWRDVQLNGNHLQVPAGVILDLGATAKAMAADLIAARVAEDLGGPVLVSLGGDISTAGARDEPWQVRIDDGAGEPTQQVSLEPGWAIATSSTLHRRWRKSGRWMHHILDPRSGLPAPMTWRTATVAAPDCLRANAFSTAAIVRGPGAARLLANAQLAARLVDIDGNVHCIGGWPEEQDADRAR
ncbi:FAD:protein FMN transferase [Microbacterium rhizosphaerae]|uniref:FAD:protein FMN transferase n=1 Tax=Microbacterium rhizosphaerae TaxID=1678237 RepID=A0ABZ0SKY6_9MICO|nr:FAD:protein FMN transferase [Microbacterium rhizosphaerae]WPR88941.1 FAD:protein FMN transferase [Microbacterium rhizosphaerae]